MRQFGSILAAAMVLFAGAAAARADKALPAGVTCTEVKLPKSSMATGGWDKSKVGDWVQYEAEPAPGFKTKTKMEVFDKGDDWVVVLNTASVAGMDIKSALKYAFTGDDPKVEDAKGEKPAVTKGKEKISAAGKDFDAETTETTVGGKKSKVWTSPEVPLGGAIKSEYDGKVTMQLVGFGRGN